MSLLVWIPNQYEDIMFDATEMYAQVSKDKWIFARIESVDPSDRVKIKTPHLKK